MYIVYEGLNAKEMAEKIQCQCHKFCNILSQNCSHCHIISQIIFANNLNGGILGMYCCLKVPISILLTINKMSLSYYLKKYRAYSHNASKCKHLMDE